MGKRNTTVVISSSEDEGDRRSSSRPRTRSKLSSTVPRANPRRSKRARVSDSRSGLGRESTDWDRIRLFCEDFDEKSTAFKVSDGSRRSNKQELWVDKYKPCSLEELAVQKKKVEEVKVWFEERLGTSKDKFSSHVLVITGQAGVGKSATIQVIASHLGARLCEWNTPTPIVWQEHLHNSSAGLQYTSKLDEFENFVERIRKYGLIPSTENKESKESVIFLIDDLPLTNGKVAFGRLKHCLYLLARSIQIPTAILVTNYGETDSADRTTKCLEELQLALENAGACKVAFNPITVNSTKKVLSQICRQEQRSVSDEKIDLIAKASRGDIRNAITSLQFSCLTLNVMNPLSPPYHHPRHLKEKLDEVDIMNAGSPLEFGRDETLSLFHALGKFLHNKRDTENAVELVGNEFFLRERFARLPMKMDAPETVLCQAHGQARPIADFLNENVLDFLSEEAIDDAWAVASYLGDADLLLTTFHGMLVRHNEADNVLQSAAASVAVRGVQFGNSHPGPSRWHAIRRPKLWQVEQLSLSNKKDMIKRRYDSFNRMGSSDFSVIATEYTPMFKWLGSGTPGSLRTCDPDELLTVNERIDMMSLDEPETMDSDDDIEDC